MKIGITFDLKSDSPLQAGQPDDLDEEFDSPTTVEAIAVELGRLGHEVVKLGDGPALLRRLLDDPPEFVFNFAEGHGVGRSREARVPAVLEMLGIPYTGSDPLTLAVTLDKDCAKRLVASAGGVVPGGVTIYPGEELQFANCRGSTDAPSARPADSSICNLQFAICNLQFPVIVKPAWEGSSKGIRGKCVVDTPEEMFAAVTAQLRDYRQPIMAEEYIAGEELTVGILGNDPPRAIGVMSVTPRQPDKRFVYSLEVKRDFRRLVHYECPAKLPPARLKAVEEAALKAYRALGCRDVARVDFRLRDGIPYFLEVNPLPGLNPESSDLVILAGLAGLSYHQLIAGIVDAARRRHSVSIAPAGAFGTT
jgi:D-alanine-D-alanine ligase